MKKILILILLFSTISCAYKLKTDYGDIEIFINAATIIGMADALEGRGFGRKSEYCLPSGVELTNLEISEAAAVVRSGGSVILKKDGKKIYIGDK